MRSEEDSDESPTECSKIKDQKSSEKVENDGPSGVENGVARDPKSDVEETDASSYVSSVTLNTCTPF